MYNINAIISAIFITSDANNTANAVNTIIKALKSLKTLSLKKKFICVPSL